MAPQVFAEYQTAHLAPFSCRLRPLDPRFLFKSHYHININLIQSNINLMEHGIWISGSSAVSVRSGWLGSATREEAVSVRFQCGFSAVSVRSASLRLAAIWVSRLLAPTAISRLPVASLETLVRNCRPPPPLVVVLLSQLSQLPVSPQCFTRDFKWIKHTSMVDYWSSRLVAAVDINRARWCPSSTSATRSHRASRGVDRQSEISWLLCQPVVRCHRQRSMASARRRYWYRPPAS